MADARRRQEVFIATLGTQPAVVTAALDLLLADGRPISEVVVIHTSDVQRDPHQQVERVGMGRMGQAVQTLDEEFPDAGRYAHTDWPCRYRRVPLQIGGRVIDDIHSEGEAQAVFRIMYRETQQYKQQGHIVHLSIAGGRKSMSVYGMAVAQLLFDADDRLWHVLSAKEFEQSDRMHPTSPQDATLVRIPVLPLGLVYVGPVGALLVTEDPAQAIEEQQALLNRRRRDQCQQFLNDVLTREERRLVKILLREVMIHQRGPRNEDLARQLVLSERTVRNRFSEIYAKLRHFFDLYDQPVDNKVLIGLYAPYFGELLD
jgi:CRISPR-associated protein Csx14